MTKTILIILLKALGAAAFIIAILAILAAVFRPGLKIGEAQDPAGTEGSG